jgi:arsenite methyltransferase
MLEMNHVYLFLGDCRFVSATFRLFKLPKTGPAKRCQVVYNGGITGHEKELIFDANFTFKVNKNKNVHGAGSVA